MAAFRRYRYHSFPVIDDHRVLGLLTMDRVEALPASRRASTRARDLVEADEDLLIDEHDDVAELLERPSFQRLGRAHGAWRRRHPLDHGSAACGKGPAPQPARWGAGSALMRPPPCRGGSGPWRRGGARSARIGTLVGGTDRRSGIASDATAPSGI